MVRSTLPRPEVIVRTMPTDPPHQRSSPPTSEAVPSSDLPAATLLAFAPLHKRVFGTACGVAVALVVFAATLSNLLRGPDSQFPLYLLSEYFFGYSVSWGGLFIGAAWGYVVGFVGGWFLAFCRNLAVAISIFAIRTRAELAQTRDFLDHI